MGLVRAEIFVESEAIPAGAQAPLLRTGAGGDIACHDEAEEAMPVKSLRSDVKRKLKLKKVMSSENGEVPQGTIYGEPILTPTSEREENDENDENDSDTGMGDNSTDTPPEEIQPDDSGQLTKEEVNYRYATKPEETCGECKWFEMPGACGLVAGLIRVVDVCDKFEAKSEAPGVFRQQGEHADQPEMQGGLKKLRDDLVPSELVVESQIEGGPGSGPQKDGGRGGTGLDVPGGKGKALDVPLRKGKIKGFDTSEGGPGSGPQGGRGDADRPAIGAAVAKAGAHFDGVQQGMGDQRFALISDKVSGSTGVVDMKNLTPSTIAAKVKDLRARHTTDVQKKRSAMKKTARGMNAEVTPPGYEPVVKGLKKSGRVDNPWAVAWWMKGQGIMPKGGGKEGGPGSGPQKGGGKGGGKDSRIADKGKGPHYKKGSVVKPGDKDITSKSEWKRGAGLGYMPGMKRSGDSPAWRGSGPFKKKASEAEIQKLAMKLARADARPFVES